MRYLASCFLLLSFQAATACHAAEEESFLLAAELADEDATHVEVTLEVGGDWIPSVETGTEKLPLSVSAQLNYSEQMLLWSTDPSQPLRSVREYQQVDAKIQKSEGGQQQELAASKRSVVVEVRNGRSVLAGAKAPLTREQFDLVNVPGNTLALNQLLPGREIAIGESWSHEAAVLGALLSMDHVAVCEVKSIVTGSVSKQVQIRLAGTVHGTIDGTPTEMQLKGAYLFHQKLKRITKMNLAIKEQRTASRTVSGLDVVAKLSLVVRSGKAKPAKDLRDSFFAVEKVLTNTMRYESPEGAFQFLHGPSWYVTGEQRDMVTMGLLKDGDLTGHCSVTTLPARSSGKQTTIEDFEREVRALLGDKLETVSASTHWTTRQGHECLGVVAQGQDQEIPLEWRYYLIAEPGLPRVSLSVTIEQAMLQQFDDADRQLVESLQLLEKTSTAARKDDRLSR